MPILKTIHCSVCIEAYTETEPNKGFPGWGQLHGITLDDEENPCLCPEHLAQTADFINGVKHGVD